VIGKGRTGCINKDVYREKREERRRRLGICTENLGITSGMPVPRYPGIQQKSPFFHIVFK